MQQQLDTPSWLLPPTTQLLHTRYEIVFETLVTKMCSGMTMAAVLRDDFREIDSGAFLRWIRKDPARSRRYDEAKEIRTEAWASRIIEEAEGVNSMNDVNRSKLIIDTHKWLMGVENKAYRPTQQVEINNQISITAALEQGMARALSRPVIEGELDDDWS